MIHPARTIQKWFTIFINCKETSFPCKSNNYRYIFTFYISIIEARTGYIPILNAFRNKQYQRNNTKVITANFSCY